MASSTSNRCRHSTDLSALRRRVIRDIRKLVDPHFHKSRSFADFEGAFFPEHPGKSDGSDPCERKIRGVQTPAGDKSSWYPCCILGFDRDGVIDDMSRGVSTLPYKEIPTDILVKLLPLARKFDEYHRKASK